VQKYFGSLTSVNDINKTWNLGPNEALTDDQIIVATMDEGSYEGSAFVLFQNMGKLYEFADSHCSCDGWGVWNPELTTFEAILIRKGIADEMRSPIILAFHMSQQFS
jgi:hypothetical protein